MRDTRENIPPIRTPESYSSHARHDTVSEHRLPKAQSPVREPNGAVSKQNEFPTRLGYYQEHGPRRYGDQEKREPTLEERFWQFTPDDAQSEDSDDSAEERELVSSLPPKGPPKGF